MKTAAMSVPESLEPLMSTRLFQDPAGNFFAECQYHRPDGDIDTFWTSTYTIAGQALDEAWSRTRELIKRESEAKGA